MNKICFVDIDGVFNRLGMIKSTGASTLYLRLKSHIHREFIQRFNQVSNLFDYIILSSTWRIGSEYENLNNMFEEQGANWKFHDRTPIKHEKSRGLEILNWLNLNNYKIEENCKIVIVDDETVEPLNQYLVETSFYDEINGGLQDYHIEEIKRRIL